VGRRGSAREEGRAGDEIAAALEAMYSGRSARTDRGLVLPSIGKRGLADPNLLPWMFAQRRGKPVVPFDKIAGPKGKRPTSLEQQLQP
jgi:hypothetical protein